MLTARFGRTSQARLHLATELDDDVPDSVGVGQWRVCRPWRLRALAWRSLPAVLLPFSVVLLRSRPSQASDVPVVLVAAALGGVTFVFVTRFWLAMLTTLVASSLLLGASYAEAAQTGDLEMPLASPAHSAAALNGVPVPKAEGQPMAMETMSVVLPCAFEGEYVERTVDALIAHTKHSRLKEIIVVDDGSDPPLASSMPQRLLKPGFLSGGPQIRLLRHNTTLGLIAAKQSGGDAAKGDVLVFFDCHIRPRDGWEEAFIRQMRRAGDHKTIVVPTITSLDPDTWEEIASGPASKACFVMWNADFTWLDNPGRDVPLMSGGLLALSRRWWEETGGYDKHMVAWGGENIDQSLRAWLCGGRIEVAQGAFVAHMWRQANNPKTRLHYPIPTKDVMRNKARAVSAWFGEFRDKAFSFPEYGDFVSGEQSVGDMSNFNDLKARLTCAPFSAYIQRFAYVYLDGGLIPDEVFQLREATSGRCLERSPREHSPHGLILAPCADASGGSGAGGILELQLWHGALRDRGKQGAPCCSGLMNWNFMQCVDARAAKSMAKTFDCDLSGYSRNQDIRLQPGPGTAQRLVWQMGAGCLVPDASPAAADPATSRADCARRVEVGQGSAFLLQGSGQPRGCVAARREEGQGGDTDSDSWSAWKLRVAACDEDDVHQHFHASPLQDGYQVRAGPSDLCLDSAGGGQLLLYPCYKASDHNPNQVWQMSDAHLVWEGASKAGCVDARAPAGAGLREVAATPALVLQTCTDKVGQRLKQHQRQPQDGSFLLRDEDSGRCLRAPQRPPGGALEVPLRLGSCDSTQRWRELQDRMQIQHVASRNCLDAGNENVPILYPCHTPKPGRKQVFRTVSDPGWVQLRGGWEDNGRRRLFEQCLDSRPEPPVQVRVARCAEPVARKAQWSRIGAFQPLERRLWNEAAAKRPAGLPPLGGEAAPP